MKDIKLVNGFPHIRYRRETYDHKEMQERSGAYYHWMDQRRTVRGH